MGRGDLPGVEMSQSLLLQLATGLNSLSLSLFFFLYLNFQRKLFFSFIVCIPSAMDLTGKPVCSAFE